MVPIADAAEVLSCMCSSFSHRLYPLADTVFSQNAPQYTKPYARSRVQPSESAPFAVLSNKDLSSTHPDETIRLKPSVSLPSVMPVGYHPSFPTDQMQKEDPEDVPEESLLSTPTQPHFELPQTPETPKASPSFSIFSYDVPPSKHDSRRAFLRASVFGQ